MAEVHTHLAARCHTGSWTSKLVLMVLAVSADDDGACQISKAEIARLAQLSPRTVYLALARLEQAGLIERNPRTIHVHLGMASGFLGGAA